jgi:hypothetical protein
MFMGINLSSHKAIINAFFMLIIITAVGGGIVIMG